MPQTKSLSLPCLPCHIRLHPSEKNTTSLLHLKRNHYILLVVCMCVYEYACHSALVKVREQPAGISSLLPLCGTSGLEAIPFTPISLLDIPLPPLSYFLVRYMVTGARKDIKSALLWMEPQQSPKVPTSRSSTKSCKTPTSEAGCRILW